VSEHKPVVGVTSYPTTASWGVWTLPALVLAESYLESLLAAGAAPLVISVGVTPADILSRLDAVVLIGGPDVNPARYGEARDPNTQPSDPQRDELEIALALETVRAGLPLLAICRGAQVLNVARGGSLIQHLPDRVGHESHSPAPGVYGTTKVTVSENSRVSHALGAEQIAVACYHHQAVDRLGAGLVASAHAPDGTVEAIEDPGARFCLGVQWHPEVGDDPSLFEALVAACS
jgi:putative glutamine amidotransferase